MSSDAAPLGMTELRPTRAELRRAREADRVRALEAEALAAGTRAERRQALERARAASGGGRPPLLAWWVLPLVLAGSVCVYVGLATGSEQQVPAGPTVLISTPSDQ